MKFERRDYQDDAALNELAHKVQAVLPELFESEGARYVAFYSSVEPDHIGGKCRKLDGAVRHRTGDDFWLLIHREPFLQADLFHKLRILIHEIHHMVKDGNAWVVRRHAGDFCEISLHDKYCYRLSLKAIAALGLKYDNTEEIKKYTGLDSV
jgi:hypothetical protein